MDCSYRVYFIKSKWYIQLPIFIAWAVHFYEKKVKNSPVLAMSRKCEKILLVASCYRNRDKLRPDGPLGSNADLDGKKLLISIWK